MHPSKEQLELFINEALPNERLRDRIAAHVNECEFCKEYCDAYSEFIADLSAAGLPEDIQRRANTFVQGTIVERVINLMPLTAMASSGEISLAADGGQAPTGNDKFIATLYSENPDVVMRIIRDETIGYGYLQIISDDMTYCSNVMIQAPEHSLEFFTDEDGRANIDAMPDDDIESMKWQIKMPEAIFPFEAVEFNPDAVESSQETTLTSDRGDSIKVTFNRLTSGWEISLGILSLGSTQDPTERRVVIDHSSGTITKVVSSDSTIVIDGVDPRTVIAIRWY